MSIINLTSIVTPGGGHRITWDTTLPNTLFRIFINGQYTETISAKYYDLAAGNFDFDVFDDDEPTAKPRAGINSKYTVRWPRSTTAASYRIELDVSGQWVTVENVPQSNLRFFEVRLLALPDDTDQTIRVIGIDETNEEWVIDTKTFRVVRYPDIPNVTIGTGSNPGDLRIEAV